MLWLKLNHISKRGLCNSVASVSGTVLVKICCFFNRGIPIITKRNHVNLFQWNVWVCVIKTLKLTNKTEIYFRKYAALLYKPLWGISTQISVNTINHRIFKNIFMLNYALLSSPIYVNILSLPYIIFIPWNRMLPGDWAINWTCFVVNFFWPFDHMHVKTAHSIWQANLILLIRLLFFKS